MKAIATFRIFKKHPFGLIAMVFWVISGIIDIVDMILSFVSRDILSGIMDLLVVIALICYILTPLIATLIKKDNPVQISKILFVIFAGITIFFDFIYLIITLVTGYFPTWLYWITVLCDILLIVFTVLGVLTTLRDVQSLNEYLFPEKAQTEVPAMKLETSSDSASQSVSSESENIKENNITQCAKCGATIKKTSAFCTKCGESTKSY